MTVFAWGALALAASAPERGPDRAAVPALAPVEAVLENGLRVVLSEDDRADVVALRLVYRVGSRDEAPGQRGVAHLFEHLMFEGSRNVPTNAFDEWLTAAGGTNNAFTGRDATAYVMEIPSGALELALFLESDRMGFLADGLDAENLRNQVGVVLQERAEARAEPAGRDLAALARLSWPEGHPYRHPVIGRVDDLQALTVDAIRSFWSEHYLPGNAVLVLVGRFDADEALARIRHWFSDVPARAAPRRASPGDVEDGLQGQHGVLVDRGEAHTLYLAWPTVPRGHADRPGLDLLTRLLADRLSGYRHKADQIGMVSFTSDLAGQAIGYASSSTTALSRLDRILRREVRRLARWGLRGIELERVRRAVRGDLLDRVESPPDRARLLADCVSMHGRADCLPTEWAAYAAVTPRDLRRLARTYLRQRDPNALSVVPRQGAAPLEGSVPVEVP